MSSELKQGLNSVEVTGVVKENKLEDNKNDKGNFINGSLIIKTGEFSNVEVKVFVSEFTKKGKQDLRYSILKQIALGELPTIADGATEEEAVKVSIWSDNNKFSAGFKEDIFKPKNSAKVVTKVNIDLGLGKFEINNKIKPEDYKAKFDVDVYVDKIKEEIKNEEETGRVVVSGYIPAYGGRVIPIEMVAGIVKDKDDNDFDFAEQFRTDVDEGTPLRLYGAINFQEIIEKKKVGGVLGMAKIEETKKYVSDLVLVGGDSSTVKINEEAIKDALAERDIKIKEIENKGSKGVGLKNKLATSKSSVKIDPNDIPF